MNTIHSARPFALASTATASRLSRFHAVFLALLLTAGALLAGCDSGVSAMDEKETGPDAVAPSVQLTSPVDNASVAGGTILEASATDNTGVVRVEFYVDGKLAGESAQSPWTYEWNTLAAGDGAHTLQAKAYDLAGNSGVSQVVGVTAKNGLVVRFTNTAPTSVRVQPAGQSARDVASGSSTEFTYETNPGTVTYSASTRGTYGTTVRWSNLKVDTEGRTSSSVTLSVGDRLFFLRMRNTSSRSTSSLYVNYDASDETKIDPFSLGGGWAGVGYFQGHSQTKIRVYSKYRFPDLGPVYWDYTDNIPNQSNYTISLTLQEKSQAAKAGSDALTVERGVPDAAPMSDPEAVVHYGEASGE